MICSKNNICAVIVSFNGHQLIANTVKCIKQQVNEVLIVDNASDELTTESLAGICSDNVVIIYNDSNYGVAFALNQGIKYANDHNYDWLLTMDQDSFPLDDMVDKLIVNANTYYKHGFVSFSPIYVESDLNGINTKVTHCQERYTVITSGNLISLKETNSIGGFCDKLFIDSVDFEFCLRLKSYHHKILRCPDAILKHSLGTTKYLTLFGKKIAITVHAPLRKYYMIRNHIYITARYFFIFPMYCLWKQVAMIRLLLQIILFENNKFDNLQYFFKGIIDGICNRYGAFR